MHQGDNFSHTGVRRELDAAPRREPLETVYLKRGAQWA